MSGIQSKRRQVRTNPAGLSMETVEIDDHEYHVSEIVCCFAVTDHRWIICFMKAQVTIALQCRIFFANPVDPRDKVLKAPCRMKVAVLQLILLGIQVFFTAWLKRKIFAELKRRPIDPVVGSECRRQNEPNHERSLPTNLQEFWKNIRRARPKVRPQVLSNFGSSELREIVRDLLFRISPCEICVGLRKACLRKLEHHGRPRKCLRKEESIGILLFDFADDPFPE